MSVVSLPMYDLPELRHATNSWWTCIAGHLRAVGLSAVPSLLARPRNLVAHWRRSDLVLSQSCGYPLVNALRGKVDVVATPVYSAPGCRGADYRSLVIVADASPFSRLPELRGKRCAINSPTSQSGANAMRALVAPLVDRGRFFSDVRLSGSHIASIAMVASGTSEVAAIDCVTYELLRRYAPRKVAGTRVLCETPAAPGLPYITARNESGDRLNRLREGLSRAFDDPRAAETRTALLLDDLVRVPVRAYRCIQRMEQDANAAGLAQFA